jgi:exosortase
MSAVNQPQTQTRATAAPTRAPSVVLSPAQMALAGAALLAAFVAVFWVFVSNQFVYAIEEPADWGHTLLVPFISGYFVWLRREDLLAQPFKANWLGVPVVVLGVAGYVASTFGPSWFVLHHNARGLSAGLTLLGLALLILGWRATRILLFPLAYWVFFGQAISDRLLQLVTQSMQDWSAFGAYGLLVVTGIDVDRSGNVITVFADGDPRQLNVAEACSGMRMLVAFLALGVAYTGLSKTWQRTALILAGVPVAIGVNILRVYSLGVLSLWSSDFAAGDFHSFIGLVWLLPALGFFLGIMWFLRNLFVEQKSEQKGEQRAVAKPTKTSDTHGGGHAG